MIHDIAYLQDWFYENETCFIIPYIENNFDEVSFNYQYDLMFKHLPFTKAIIEDFKMTNEEKQKEVLNMLAYGKSKIVLIEGSRGSGKTATACWTANNLYETGKHKRVYFVKKGEPPRGFPKWMKIVDEVEDVPNHSIAIIDESAIKYNARNSWSEENKDFTSRLVILRHKDISVILITQHNKMVEINVRRLADIKISKKGANLSADDESQDDEKRRIRNRLRPINVNEVLVEIPSRGKFFKFNHNLPDWWSSHISKSFQDFNPELETKLSKKERIEMIARKSREDFERKKELEIAKIKAMAEAGIPIKKKAPKLDI